MLLWEILNIIKQIKRRTKGLFFCIFILYKWFSLFAYYYFYFKYKITDKKKIINYWNINYDITSLSFINYSNKIINIGSQLCLKIFYILVFTDFLNKTMF